MDTETQAALDNQSQAMKAAKKPPRKPRPSEIAAKKAKAAKAKKPAKSKPKPKAKKPVKKAAKRKAPAKTKPKPKGKRKAPVKARGPERSERLDMRLSKAEKAKLRKIAKRKDVPITEIVWGAIAKLK